MFLVIDGSSLLATHFYGSLPNEVKFAKSEKEKERYYSLIMHNSKGIYTNAIYGALDAIFKILHFQKPDHLLVVLDKTSDTFRRKLYPEYKVTRTPKPMPYVQQQPNFAKALKYIGIPVLFSDDYEADDLAGSVVRKFEKQEKCICMTKDHDYLQLIDRRVKCWLIQASPEKLEELEKKYFDESILDEEKPNLPHKVFEFSSRHVRGEEGVKPIQIIDKKALCGDKSDNIPGVHGIGETAAVPLLQHYGTVEKIYEEIDKATAAGQEKELSLLWRRAYGISKSPLNALIKGRDMCMLSKQLATIKLDCPVPENLDWYVPHVDPGTVRAVCNSLEIPMLA